MQVKIFGDAKYRGDCPSEFVEQVTFFNTLRRDYPKLAKIAIHVRNEGKRTHAQIIRQKMEGFVKGAPDIVIPGGQTFLCEMKRRDKTKSKISKDQLNYLECASDAGAFACIALGCDAALEALKEWLR